MTTQSTIILAVGKCKYLELVILTLYLVWLKRNNLAFSGCRGLSITNFAFILYLLRKPKVFYFELLENSWFSETKWNSILFIIRLFTFWATQQSIKNRWKKNFSLFWVLSWLCGTGCWVCIKKYAW